MENDQDALEVRLNHNSYLYLHIKSRSFFNGLKIGPLAHALPLTAVLHRGEPLPPVRFMK